MFVVDIKLDNVAEEEALVVLDNPEVAPRPARLRKDEGVFDNVGCNELERDRNISGVALPGYIGVLLPLTWKSVRAVFAFPAILLIDNPFI